MDFLRHLFCAILVLSACIVYAQGTNTTQSSSSNTSTANSPKSNGQLTQSALFSQSLHHFTQGRYKDSFDGFFQLTQQNPQNAVYRYNLCQSYYKLGNFPYAVTCYNGVINSQSKLREQAMFYKAITLINLEREEEASLLLRKLFYETKSNEMKRLVRFTLQAIADGTDVFLERAFKAYNENNFKECVRQVNQSVFSDAGYGNLLKAMAQFSLGQSYEARRNVELVLLYAKDPNIVQTAQEMKTDPPPPLVSDEGEIKFVGNGQGSWSTDDNVYQSNSSSESDTAITLQATAGIEVHLTPKQNFGASITGRHFDFQSHSDLDEQEVIMELYTYRTAAYTRNHFGFYSSRLAYNNSDSLSKTGLNYSFEKTMAENLKFGVIADAAYQDSMDANYDYLKGNLYKLKVYSNFMLKRGEIAPYFQYSQQSTQEQILSTGTLPSAFRGTSLGLILIYHLNPKSYVQINSALATKNYSPASQPGDRMRSDSQSSFLLKYQYQLKKEYYTFVEFSQVSNHSSLDDNAVINRTFNQNSILAGIGFEL